MNGRRHGFTLVELLVVIAIVIVVVALVVPSLTRVRTTAKRVQCANNLHLIGQAFIARRVDERLQKVPSLVAPGWSEQLAPYLLQGHLEETLRCPSITHEGAATSATIGSMVVYVWGAYDMPLEPGPLTRQTMLSDGSYLLEFEDIRPGGGDMDYNDVVLQVDTMSSGRVKITVNSISAGYHFDLLGPNREMLIHDLHQHVGDNVITEAGGSRTYGMNKAVRDFPSESSWILLMDYVKEVADCGGADAMDNWGDWVVQATGLPEFARHGGRCNVLFADTSVRSVTPAEINPDVPALAEHYWDPALSR